MRDIWFDLIYSAPVSSMPVLVVSNNFVLGAGPKSWT